MESTPRGICLIISNKTFKRLGQRLGTEMDVESLSTVFDWLGFKVLLCMDQKKQEIERVVKVISQLKNVSDPGGDLQYLADLKQLGLYEYVNGEYALLREVPQHGDAFICSILTHGNESGVAGVDDKVLPINNLLSPFNGENCPALIGKPKVFFIQACRGNHPMGEVKQEPVDGEAEPYKNLGSSRNLPSEADFLIVEATVLHYVSYRNSVLGAHFIQALCHELILHCPRY
ncbi:caspase-8-like [Osmerus eperlanus]|uniref:caspase-8-like n=1 Tax=Osmerus eperlanus TaxID=29151 RepID=UPI002E120D05